MPIAKELTIWVEDTSGTLAQCCRPLAERDVNNAIGLNLRTTDHGTPGCRHPSFCCLPSRTSPHGQRFSAVRVRWGGAALP